MNKVCVVGELNLDLVLYGLSKDLESDAELLASDIRVRFGIYCNVLLADLTSTTFSPITLIEQAGEFLPALSLRHRHEISRLDCKHIKRNERGRCLGRKLLGP